jgi:hypothetical protein
MARHGAGSPGLAPSVFEPRQRDILPPGQSANDPLENGPVWPRCGERPHRGAFVRRRAPGIREFGAQIGDEPVRHPGAPAVHGLAFADVVADLPVKADQFAVYGERGAEPRRADPGLEVGKPGGVAGGCRGHHCGCRIAKNYRKSPRSRGCCHLLSEFPRARFRILRQYPVTDDCLTAAGFRPNRVVLGGGVRHRRLTLQQRAPPKSHINSNRDKGIPELTRRSGIISTANILIRHDHQSGR